MLHRSVIITVLLLLVLVFFSLPVEAETLCHYAGPDISPEFVKLTNFTVIGPANLKEGDTITVNFTLENFGQVDLTLPKREFLRLPNGRMV